MLQSDWAATIVAEQGRRKLVRTGAAIHWDIGGCVTHSFKVHSRKMKNRLPEYFMMATVVYTNNSAGIAGAVMEILVGE